MTLQNLLNIDPLDDEEEEFELPVELTDDEDPSMDKSFL